MTDAEARDLEAYWGRPGPAPNPGWRLCYRCGDWWPSEPRYWCMPHRLCRPCKNDERRGIWPYRQSWHRKNRWSATGRLLRRCRVCRHWHPLTDYYLQIYRDHGKARNRRQYPGADCIRCTLLRLKRGWGKTRIRDYLRQEAA